MARRVWVFAAPFLRWALLAIVMLALIMPSPNGTKNAW